MGFIITRQNLILNIGWTYGVLVSFEINSVVAEDGFNFVHKNGGKTGLWSNLRQPTESEYKAKYAILGLDGLYYWK